MNKKVIFVGIVTLTLTIFPLGVKNIVDSSINLKKTELVDSGILLDIENSEGYVTSSRDFKITINDEKKFKNYFKTIIVKQYPMYQNLLEETFKDDSKGFDEFLKGIVLKGNIKNSNMNPFSDINVYTYVDKLSDNIMEEIKKYEKSSEIILSLFEKEVLAFNLVFDSNSKLKTMTLKDINENIKSTSEISTQVLGYKVTNNSTEKEIIADIKVDKISTDIKFDKNDPNRKLNENASFDMHDLKINFTFENQLVNNGNMEIGSININGANSHINLGKTKILSYGKNTNGIYSTKSEIKIEKFSIDDGKLNIDFDNLNLDMYLNDVSYKNIQHFQKTFQDVQTENLNNISLSKEEIKEKTHKSLNSLLREAISLLNDGLSLKIDAKLLGLIEKKLNLKKIKLDIDARIDKNDLTLETYNSLSLMNITNVKANLVMDEEDYVSLSTLFPQVKMMTLNFIKKENGNVKFSFNLKKGKIEVNGQKLN